MDIESLNDKQKDAVLNVGGPMLVFAGAGSGKTRVLTYKISYLIQNVGMPPENILAVTFTNKAAQEMKSRVHDLVDVDISGITIGTFHSIGAMILRKEIWRLGWDANFTIYDQSDSKALIKSLVMSWLSSSGNSISISVNILLSAKLRFSTYCGIVFL